MYEYISGKLIEKTPTSIVLDVNGVGYSIQIPVSTFASLPTLGEEAKLLTHFVVREDVQALYGFASTDERQLFRQLISISGIGPRMGLTVLSGKTVSELKQAIASGSLAFLTSISGIGKKIAERIIVELREKIVVEDRISQSDLTSAPSKNSALMEDSLNALIELGYRKNNAQKAIEKAMDAAGDKTPTVSDLIRASLKYV